MPDTLGILLRPLLPIIGHIIRFLPKDDPEWVHEELALDHMEYPAYPIRAGAEAYDVIIEMRRNLPLINKPVMLVQSMRDKSVDYTHAEKIYTNLGTQDKQILWLENSGHVVTRDADRELVFEEISNFVHRVVRDAEMRRILQE